MSPHPFTSPEIIDAPIRVGVIFQGDKRPKIKFFEYKNKHFMVDKLNLVTRALLGDRPIYFYSVTAQESSFQLMFNPWEAEWRLYRIYSEGF